MLYNTVCRFSCKEGFEAKGSVVRGCTENGTWSGTDLACRGIPHRSGLSVISSHVSDALLEICGIRSNLPVPANLKLLFVSTFSFVLNNTNVAWLTNQRQGFLFSTSH